MAFILGARNKDIAYIVSMAGATIKGDSLMLKQAETVSKSGGTSDAMWELYKPTLRARYAILAQDKKH